MTLCRPPGLGHKTPLRRNLMLVRHRNSIRCRVARLHAAGYYPARDRALDELAAEEALDRAEFPRLHR